MSMRQARRNLVVVRAGPSSLHRSWIGEEQERTFDVLVSYFDEQAFKADRSTIAKVFVPGGKWDGLHKTLRAIHLEAYDFVWLPDDDIDARPQDVDRMFALACRHNLAVCQPALTLDSYFSHFIVLACHGFRLRYTNFVEIMVPCLRRDTLERILPFFADTMSGFGLDDLWCRLQADNNKAAAILDDVHVRHTRPPGLALERRVEMSGRTPDQELDEMRSTFGVERYMRSLAYAGILTDGKEVTGERKMGLLMAACYLRLWPKLLDKAHARKRFFRLLRWQLARRADLTPLSYKPPSAASSVTPIALTAD
jgi:hypothetical protein